jgi:hypothetical protein
MFEFDELGNLKGNKIHTISIVDFEKHFVSYTSNSSNRTLIYKDFIDLITAVKTIVNANFYILVDGSFVSNKESPNDIDFVFVIPVNLLENKLFLEQLKKHFYTLKNKKNSVLDFYIIPDAIENSTDDFRLKTESLLTYWTGFFGKTRKDEFGKQQEKGILKIEF